MAVSQQFTPSPASVLHARRVRLQRLRRLPWLVVLPVVLAVLLVAGAAAGLRLNVTESLPLGLYRASPFQPETAEYGDLVTFCARPEAIGPVAPYLIAGDDCSGADGRVAFAELAKAIVALPGDVVTVDAAGVAVNGRRLPHSAPLAYSRSGAPVAAALGTHVLGRGEYWLYSGRVPYSLDSRYFGRVTDVRSRLRPVRLWGHRVQTRRQSPSSGLTTPRTPRLSTCV